MRNRNRRDFLRLGTRTLCGAGLALGSNPMLTLAQAGSGDLLFDSNDYRALVCIYLKGGSDGFNLLVPIDQAEFNEYAYSRQHLAANPAGLLPLSSNNSNIPNCGLNAHAQALSPLYQEGNLAFISNVGTLIQPTTKEQYENRLVSLPAQLFSHNDQEIQWQQLQGQITTPNGWGALAAEYLNSNTQRDYLTSVTLSGSNYWQSSDVQRPFSIKADGVLEYSGMSNLESRWQDARRDAFTDSLQQHHPHVLTQAYAELQNRAANISADLGAALTGVSEFTSSRPVENKLADDLHMVAQLISLRHTLGMNRQIFYVSMKGWDVHDAQDKELPELYRQLSEAMVYFHSLMFEIGQTDNVTSFTASDFGRSLTGNGDGTDHGWGNHHMVMGGAVRGADIYGSIPRMSVDGPDAVRNGRVVPTLSATQYAATLLQWLGLNDTQLDDVLPTLRNFTQRNLDFLV